jgi:RimJ/RimL family protein N-acetyltransferase
MSYEPIVTERLILAQWTPAYRDAATVMNADPYVMRHFLAPLTRAETDAQVDRQEAALREKGFCFWAIVRRSDGRFLGLCGLKDGAPDTPIEGELEIGWRFDQHGWGQGYATEAARAAMAHGFTDPAVKRICAITTLANRESWRVMERLGMTRDLDKDFDHPMMPVGHPNRPHITHSITRAAFDALQQKAG